MAEKFKVDVLFSLESAFGIQLAFALFYVSADIEFFN